ncbi:ABC transporter permease [Candidatus Daviesbacteria bacterium]|nr:ABC transporter permease [Candidatus Daviesbacteria bacterium]
MNINRISAIILRHYFLSLRQLERFFDVLISPVLMVMLWGFMTKYVQTLQSQTLAAFLLGGILLWIIFEKVGTDIGVNFMFDIWDRNFINVISTPITFVEYLAALVIVSLIKIFFAFSMMGLIAAIFYNFQITSLGFGLALFAVNLFMFAASFGIFNIALVLRFGHSIGPLTWIIPFLVQPFAAVFYPLSVLPPVFQKIAYLIPISHVFEGMRYVIVSGQFNTNLFWHSLILNIIYLTLSIIFFAFILKSVLKGGKLVKVI